MLDSGITYGAKLVGAAWQAWAVLLRGEPGARGGFRPQPLSQAPRAIREEVEALVESGSGGRER